MFNKRRETLYIKKGTTTETNSFRIGTSGTIEGELGLGKPRVWRVKTRVQLLASFGLEHHLELLYNFGWRMEGKGSTSLNGSVYL